MKKKIDMTSGPILSNVFLFALPLCLGNILQTLYTTVDTLVIGNYCNSQSLAAVGTSSQPVEILLCLFMGIGSGTSILVSQHAGSKDYDMIRELLHSAVAFLYMVAVPVTVMAYFLGPLLLRLMNVPDDTIGYAADYIRILVLGTLGSMGYNMNSGVLKGMGDSRSSLIFLFISCIVNVVLDLTFVAVFSSGVTGVALATVISQFISWISSIIYIKCKYPELDYRIFPGRPDPKYIKQITNIGLPLGFNTSIYSVGHIFVQALINAQGTTFMAAVSIAGKVTGIANIAITSLSAAGSTFSGQNYGAHNIDRLKKGHMMIPLVSGAITFVSDMIFLACCRPILRLFSSDAEVLYYARFYLYFALGGYFIYAIFNGIINYAHGVGEIKYPTIINILTLWGVRIPVAWLITRYFDGTYCIAAYPVSFLFGMCMMLIFYRTGSWKKHLV